MKVTSFCSSNPTEEQIKKLIELEWLSHEDDWEFRDKQILVDIQESFLGIDQRKLKSLIEVTDSTVVLVEERFAVQNDSIDSSNSIWFEENLLVLSTTNLRTSILLIIQVGLYLFHWRLRKEFSCDNVCFFNAIPILELPTICQSCENLLYQKGFVKDAITGSSLSLVGNTIFHEGKLNRSLPVIT